MRNAALVLGAGWRSASRVVRYREEKTAAETDTIDTVRAIHAPSRGEDDG